MRIKRALDGLGKRGIECGIVLKPENIYYLTGFFPSSFSALVLGREPKLLVSKMESMLVKDIGVEVEVVKRFKSAFQDLGCKEVAIEKRYATFGFYEKYLKGKELSDLDLLEEMRLVKDGNEIAAIEEACSISKGVMEKTSKGLVGRTEGEVAAEVEFAIRKASALPAFETIVASGRNSWIPHNPPSERVIGAGDAVVVDLGAKVRHYHSDMTRTFCETPDEDFIELHRIVSEAQEAGIREVRPGNELKRVEEAVRAVIKEYGLDEHMLHSSGHGIGLEIHERPRLSTEVDGTFKENMVVTVEPGVYKNLGVRIEDTVLVGKRPKVLTR